MQHTISKTLSETCTGVLKDLYQLEVESIEWQATRKEFAGDLTLVVFPYLKASRKKPEDTAQEIGTLLQERHAEVKAFNVVKGFLNISISDSYWQAVLHGIQDLENYGKGESLGRTTLVEYSSPNTNKPLHLGHIRNNLLGYSVAEILSAAGHTVKKVQIINDRGIHICKSMVAWQHFAEGETPETSGLKGDHLVGKYYVAFDKAYKEQIAQLMAEGKTEEEAKEHAPIFQEAREMLLKWEQGDAAVVALWQKMNAWVYAGFDASYRRLGVNFDKNYYESETYLLGKKIVEEGVAKGVFFKKEDGSVWCDLEAEKLGEKLLLRRDGTSVYMTQDIGTAIQRYEDFGIDGMIYTVGNEQDYHFQVLFAILKKLGYAWAENLYHLSYGMVDLPSGKMKSREGTVVDADDLMEQMISTAQKISEDLGKTDGLSEAEKNATHEMIGLGALKYFILKVDPRKRMLFNPEESIDFQGNTGPFIQYTHARIKSLLRKAGQMSIPNTGVYQSLAGIERDLIKQILNFPSIIQQAAADHAPSLIANYVYDLVKTYNGFYQQLAILNDENPAAVHFRIDLSRKTAAVVSSAMRLLGITVPEQM
ncbi:MAG: arginine--tRNA ligase [Bacteroidetes bacterium]|nr:MAG: arginine--tRNA ligase [Bacteroidota bacterium]